MSRTPAIEHLYDDGVEDGETVSVVMATYNGEQYLTPQLESLVDQDRRPDEVVIVDDGSTDGTVALLREFAERAPFPVNLIDREEHRGTSVTFAEGLRAAKYDLLMICDQDDVWLRHKISTMIRYMAAAPDALLGFSDARLIDVDGKVIGDSRWKIAGFTTPQWRAMTADPFGQMQTRQIVSGCTTAIRSTLVPALLPFPAGLHRALPDMIYDRWASLMATAAGAVVVIPEQLIDYRIHPHQQIGIPSLALRRVAPHLAIHAGQFVFSRHELEQRSAYHLAHLELIQKRLDDAGLLTPEAEQHLELAAEHIKTRGRLDIMRRRRPRYVLEELRKPNGYRRFSLGITTAIADLFR